MPVVAMPDGTQVRFPDDMSREEIRSIIRKKFPETDPQIGGKAYQFGRGAVQGAIFDPVEGIGQLIEHASGMKIPIPQSVRNWFDKVRENTEATGVGTAGRWTGTLGSLALAPEAMLGAKALGLTGRAAAAAATPAEIARLTRQMGTPAAIRQYEAYAKAMGKAPVTNAERHAALLGNFAKPTTTAGRVARQAAIGAGVGATQPVAEGEDFATQKLYQALAGGSLAGLAGSPLGEIALRAARHHPWATAAAVLHPASHVPTLAILSGMLAQKGLAAAGERVAAPIGAAAGRVLSGERQEEQDGETD